MKATEAQVYVGTYGKYNNGSIKGAWLELSNYNDYQEFLEACAELHKNEADPEYMPQDWEGLGGVEEFSVFERVRLYYLWMEAGFEPEKENEQFMGFLDNESGSATEESYTRYQESYQGEFDSVEDYARQCVEDGGLLKDVPDSIVNYFDFEQYARDMELNGDIWSCRNDNGKVFVYMNQ